MLFHVYLALFPFDLLSFRVAEILRGGCLSAEVGHKLAFELRRQFGPNWADESFAVRSSAVGEDSTELSAAGQLETFLAVSGIDEVLENT